MHGSLVFNRAAHRYARRAVELDNYEEFVEMDEFARRGRSAELEDTALAAVLTSTMAVDAIVNELYLQFKVAHEPGAWFQGITVTLSERLHDAWKCDIDRLGILERCQMAVLVAGKEPMPPGRGASQQFDLLVQLRNELVHHKPRSFALVRESERADSDDKLNRKLIGAFKKADIWRDSTVSFRWTGCLGGDCARWAYETARDFQREFFAHLGFSYNQQGTEAVMRDAGFPTW